MPAGQHAAPLAELSKQANGFLDGFWPMIGKGCWNHDPPPHARAPTGPNPRSAAGVPVWQILRLQQDETPKLDCRPCTNCVRLADAIQLEALPGPVAAGFSPSCTGASPAPCLD